MCNTAHRGQGPSSSAHQRDWSKQASMAASAVRDAVGSSSTRSSPLPSDSFIAGISHSTERHTSEAAHCFPAVSRERKERPTQGRPPSSHGQRAEHAIRAPRAEPHSLPPRIRHPAELHSSPCFGTCRQRPTAPADPAHVSSCWWNPDGSTDRAVGGLCAAWPRPPEGCDWCPTES